jgi:hypothetical protein
MFEQDPQIQVVRFGRRSQNAPECREEGDTVPIAEDLEVFGVIAQTLQSAAGDGHVTT